MKIQVSVISNLEKKKISYLQAVFYRRVRSVVFSQVRFKVSISINQED